MSAEGLFQVIGNIKRNLSDLYNLPLLEDKILEYTDGLLRNATELLTTSWKTERLPIPQSMEAPFMRMIELPELEGLSTYVSRIIFISCR